VVQLAKDRKVELLAQVPLFSACTDKDLKAIASLMDRVEMKEGTVLATEGEPGREMFVIGDGKASVSIKGKEIATLGPGDFFGEMALLDQGPRSATVTVEDDSVLYVVDPRGFSSLIEQNPTVTRKILRVLAQRLRTAEKGASY